MSCLRLLVYQHIGIGKNLLKSRGMIHWHGLCWRSDREPHNLLYNAIDDGLLDPDCANVLSQWATEQFGLSASHPAGKHETEKPRKLFGHHQRALQPYPQNKAIHS
jgi:hypothetical protein